MSEEDAFH